MSKIFINLDFQSQGVINLPFNANGTGNSISNIETADFATNVIDTDVTLTANSDSRIASQKAVKTYVSGLLAANDALVFKGGLDASGTNLLPAGNAGDLYKITVAGNFTSTTSTLEVGDTVICSVDSTVADTPANWIFLQTNIVAATESLAGVLEIATQAETNAGTDDVRAVTPAKLAAYFTNLGVTSSYESNFLIAGWVGGAAPYTLTYSAATHGQGDVNSLHVSVYDSSGDDVILNKNVNNTNGTVIISSNVKFDGVVRISA